MDLQIRSSNPRLLERATALAKRIADGYRTEDVVGIAFLGAIVRGYFDEEADIDISIFTRRGLGESSPPLFQRVDGLQIHTWVSSYAVEESASWPMNKRWAYSECRIHHDPDGCMAGLLARKVPLGAAERERMLITGATLSEWYINRLTELWVARGSLPSAHSMFDEGLSHFFTMLFALNSRLVPDQKWRLHYAARLPVLPERFMEGMGQVMTARDLGPEELRRRIKAFMTMWEGLIHKVEAIVGKKYEEFKETF